MEGARDRARDVAVGTVRDVRFPMHADSRGTLGVYETGSGIPFDVRRVFAVSARAGEVRGNHAHRLCSQLFVCVAGKIKVICDDGDKLSEHLLADLGTGLLVPPRVWASEEYLEDSVLLVMCDRIYENEDYIREYEAFRAVLRADEQV